MPDHPQFHIPKLANGIVKLDEIFVEKDSIRQSKNGLLGRWVRSENRFYF